MAPDIEWREPPGAPGVAGVFRGRATVHVWRMRDGRAVEWSCHTDTALLQAARHSR
jgi:hypothetical protein